MADLAAERLHAAVDVLVLLETTRRGEGLAALGARVRARAHVLLPDVPLEARRVREGLGAVLAVEAVDERGAE